MKTEDKLDMILNEAMKDSWSGKFQVLSDNLGSFINAFTDDVLGLELELRRRGDDPDFSKVRRFLRSLNKAQQQMKKILTTVARSKGL